MADKSAYEFALRMINIQKNFGLVSALKNINLDVGRNEIVGLIGDNGAGKSTMVKILTGVFLPSSGELHVAGQKVDLKSYNVKRAQGISECVECRGYALKIFAFWSTLCN
jgi:simple sugar transport system ATP-binding protein